MQADVKQKMPVKEFSYTVELQGFEVKALQITRKPLRVIVKVVADGGDTRAQGIQPFSRHVGMHLIRPDLLLVQCIPLPVQALEGLVQYCRGVLPNPVEALLVEACAVHLTGALDQIVRFVHQCPDLPLVGLGKPVQQRGKVEVIVVVGNDHIRPACHFLTQVIRAHLMCEGDLAQCLLIQRGLCNRRLSRCGQTVVKTFGQRAGIAITGIGRVFTGLVPRDQFQYPQGRIIGAGIEHLQRVEGQLSPRCLGGQEQHFVQLLDGHGLEQRKQGADGFAYPRGGLRHQTAATTRRLVDGFSQRALAGAKLRMGKCQRAGRIITRLPMLRFLFGPSPEQHALLIEKRL